MSSGSARLHLPVDLHQHEDPPGDSGRSAIPDGKSEGGSPAGECTTVGRLWREDGALLFQDAAGGEPQAVRVAWARPLSDRGGPVSIMVAGKKREVAYLPSLDALSEESRRIALEELEAGAILPVITAVYSVRPRFGNYYWDVETSLGRKTFLLSSPESNSYRPRPDVVVIKDVSGNWYEIASVSGLSATSRREMERVL